MPGTTSGDRLTSGTPTALAFRGYNQSNRGRTRELMAVAAYRPIVRHWRGWADRLCAEHAGLRTDLIQRVVLGEDPPPKRYAESVALVFATEMAQLEIAQEIHGVDLRAARFSFGYSLGELIALAAGGFVSPDAVLVVPLALADDCAALAGDVRLAVVFSRAEALPLGELIEACRSVSDASEAVGVSAGVSPNTALVIGKAEKIEALPRLFPRLRSLRIRFNDGVWPPLHTPLVRARGVCDRAARLVASTVFSFAGPAPAVFSLVTGRIAYESGDPRRVLLDWTDQPQRLWDAVRATLASDVRRVVHIGPKPNVIPSTFARLAADVTQHTQRSTAAGIGRRAVQSLVERPWLAAMLPRDACLLRAPGIEHVVREDWLLDHAPASSPVVSGWSADSVSSAVAEPSARFVDVRVTGSPSPSGSR